MRWRDLLLGALVEIRAHKVRSALTCASLAFGVAAALYTLSQIASVNKRYTDAIALAGPGRLDVRKKDGYTSRGLSRGLTIEDAAAVRARFPELYMVYPLQRRWGGTFQHGTFRNKNMKFLATTGEWSKRDWVYTQRGRFLNSHDVREGTRVCVLVQPGGWVKKPYWARYFPDTPYGDHLKKHDLLGHWVMLEGRPFRVVGVLKEPARDKDPRWFREGGGDGTVIVPITSYRQNLVSRWERKPDAVEKIVVDSGDPTTAGRYLREISRLLAYRHRGEKDFDVKDYRELMANALENIRRFIASVAAIGIVAMLAGGIGILNVTLATVFSRVREIGVRRALGATRRDIVFQFVAEALMLGSISGVVGSALGASAVFWLSPSDRQISSFSLVYALASTGIALLVSFLFSVGPAWQASRLDPVVALRYE